ncbi:MAG: VWA domain-containing protein [Proteobacteria bacterium]|nr:VWA domain-containing protein [Pseudomonadota bacterium]
MSKDLGRVEEAVPGANDNADIFLSFFYHLRSRGLKVTPSQWLTLVQGLCLGLHGSSLTGFYSLARSILMKDESELDEFDLVFAEHFREIDAVATTIEDDVRKWLENPIAPYAVDPAWQKMLDEIDVEALREEFEQRLKEQTEQHDGGNRWVGTGGTSPFGHSGHHPGGIRVGGQGRSGSAVQVAAERHYREQRQDLILDTRQLGMALKKLTALEREGAFEELDVEATIDRTAREGGELELVFDAPRKNNICLLLAMDVGGSMEPFRHLTNLLFSAAHNARHFKRFEHVYFHNCVYESVYVDAGFTEPIPLPELFRSFGRDTRLVFVGDAHMYPGELTQSYGAIQWNDRNKKPGAHYLKQLCDHFKHTAWLNPMDESWWHSPSISLVGQLFPMYPLTVEGVEKLAKDLV